MSRPKKTLTVRYKQSLEKLSITNALQNPCCPAGIYPAGYEKKDFMKTTRLNLTIAARMSKKAHSMEAY